jgi:Thioredoxin-like
MKPVLLLLAAILLAPAAHAGEIGHSYPEARPFAAAPGPTAAVKAAFERATQTEKRVMLVFGMDACHDSRGLAGWFETPRFAAMLQARYEIVWIDVGRDRKRHQSLAKRYGVAPIVGTPTVLVLDADGAPLNLAEAGGWRNAASRSEDAIFDYFAKLGKPA